MPIQILPPQLANQIAAGEVVERPASVVKELIENALDAGATEIEIEIERGGHKRICVRDNGAGINREELGLALSRHATSKIGSLEDLEHIVSLGFRGEALASVSSVSRLTLTSKPAAQENAWQAIAQGRDMQIDIQPAAHPNGTSVEVQDLFFNTPARRKFLKAEKTEFGHIDEVIRRIALSRFDVACNVKHNGKVIRKYPLISHSKNQIKRITAICGSAFADSAISINSQYQSMQLTGWLAGVGHERQHNDLQYVYVNGRVMRDKLINHAIRQAYEGLINPDLYPAYVLYLNLEPQQVDVNVHPAKHEVRFHQARLVHDFIFRAITDALGQSLARQDKPQEAEMVTDVTQLEPVEPRHDYIKPLDFGQPGATKSVAGSIPATNRSAQSERDLPQHQNTPGYAYKPRAAQVSREAAANYQGLMTGTPQSDSATAGFLIVDENWLLVSINSEFYKISPTSVFTLKLYLDYQNQRLVQQPLLMPVSIGVKSGLQRQLEHLLAGLRKMAIEITLMPGKVLLKQVPAGTRALNWAGVLSRFLEILETTSDQFEIASQLAMELLDNGQTAMLWAIATELASRSTVSPESLSSAWHELATTPAYLTLLCSAGHKIPLSEWLNQHD